MRKILFWQAAKYLIRRLNSRELSPATDKYVLCNKSSLGYTPSVAIIIPTRDKVELLKECIDSLFEKTSYQNFNIYVIDNQSKAPSTLDYFEQLKSRGVSILKFNFAFNFSAISNFAAENTSEDFLCFLNNDTEVLSPDWLSSMIGHAVDPGAGVVGAKLLYGDGTIQHFGVALGHTGAAGHVYSGWDPNRLTELGLDKSCLNVSAITFACALVERKKFYEVAGLDEGLRIGLNDIDFCLKLTMAGYSNFLCVNSVLLHHESKSRKSMKSFRGAFVATSEILKFVTRWGDKLSRDGTFVAERVGDAA